MKKLLYRLATSVKHLQVLDDVFYKNHKVYKSISDKLNAPPFNTVMEEIELQIYAGGKKVRGSGHKLARQMILGDLMQYIFTGRAFYYGTYSTQHLNDFLKLILYTVNQILIYDSITVNSNIRTYYIKELEKRIPLSILYEKTGDQVVANILKRNPIKIGQTGWSTSIDLFVDSILPKTLGNPKELIVFAELIQLKKGIIIPLLLVQRTFGIKDPIAPPDFLIIKPNKDIFGIEVGYAKEGQSREFTLRTSIPTMAVDLKNNMHNRCPKCGEFILYCDRVIEAFVDGTLHHSLDPITGRNLCIACPKFRKGRCKFSNYYGFASINDFAGTPLKKSNYHFHSACVLKDSFPFRNRPTPINSLLDTFFAQIPEIQGLESL
jgi:hypothetical protein